MKMTPVTSSNIAAIGYHQPFTALFVEFKNGKTFSYSDVSPEEHAALMAVESVGKHFNQFIKAVKVGSEVAAVVDESMTDKEKIKLLREALEIIMHSAGIYESDGDFFIGVREDAKITNAVNECYSALEATKGGE